MTFSVARDLELDQWLKGELNKVARSDMPKLGFVAKILYGGIGYKL
jgi:hypothetical protein